MVRREYNHYEGFWFLASSPPHERYLMSFWSRVQKKKTGRGRKPKQKRSATEAFSVLAVPSGAITMRRRVVSRRKKHRNTLAVA